MYDCFQTFGRPLFKNLAMLHFNIIIRPWRPCLRPSRPEKETFFFFFTVDNWPKASKKNRKGDKGEKKREKIEDRRV